MLFFQSRHVHGTTKDWRQIVDILYIYDYVRMILHKAVWGGQSQRILYNKQTQHISNMLSSWVQQTTQNSSQTKEVTISREKKEKYGY